VKLDTIINMIDEAELLNEVKNLISIPSDIYSPGQEKRINRFVLRRLKEHGINANLQEVEPGRCNVIAKIKGNGNGKSLALNGHLDTVPPVEKTLSTYNPVVKNGRLYGRGSVDMKGAVGSVMYVLFLLKKSKVHLKGDLYFTGVVGEENGGIGTIFLVKSGFKTDFAVVGEPTNLDFVTSHKGVQRLNVTIKGKTAHASTPEKGVSAITAMAEFIQVVEKELKPRLCKRIQENVGHSTINFGKIQGGRAPNMVADLCNLQIDRRWTEVENLAQVLSEIKDVLYRVCSKNPGLKSKVVPILPANEYFGPFIISESHELLKYAVEASNKVRIFPKITGMNGWTDAATLMHAGVPTVIFGPGSMEQAHTDNEWIDIKQLKKAVKCYLAFTERICGWEE